jgi:hypothetical protein
MSPILGIMASSISGSKAVTNSYESIATVTLSSTTSTISFTSIPSTFKHLQIRAFAKSDSTVADSKWQFNSDAGSNYAFHLLVGNGSTANAYNGVTQTYIKAAPYIDNTSNVGGVGVTDILDYSNTSEYKTVRTLTGMDNNTVNYGQVQFYSGLWQSTSAITSITITPSSGNYAQYSSFALYGIRG